MPGAINHVITRGLNHQDIFLTTATGMTFLIDRSGKQPKRRNARSVARDAAETLAAMANADGEVWGRWESPFLRRSEDQYCPLGMHGYVSSQKDRG